MGKSKDLPIRLFEAMKLRSTLLTKNLVIGLFLVSLPFKSINFLTTYFTKIIYRTALHVFILMSFQKYLIMLNNLATFKKNIINDVKINYKDEKAKKRYRIENWYLTDDEVKIIIDYCLTKHKKVYADLFLWLYLTGMRIGEACAIQLKNIYLKQNTWYASVTGTMISVVGHSEVKQDTPKTATSRRTIALPNQAVDIYQRNSKIKLLMISFLPILQIIKLL